MTLQEFVAIAESKYAIILAANYDADPVAQSISASPRRFVLHEIEYVILSLDPQSIPQLYGYVLSTGNSVEFEYRQGTGAVKLLTHSDAINLLNTANQSEE